MSKLLISGGCSFSECVSPGQHTWPIQLAKRIGTDYKAIHTGRPSQGNGLISRKVLYQCVEALKTTNPDDILVGVMWSGPSRHDFYHQDNIPTPVFEMKESWMEHPTRFVKNSPGGWVMLHHDWISQYAKTYYRYFSERYGGYIYTLEHILRLQWFLERNKIKYFMTTYSSEVFPDNVKTHPETSYLYNQIDMNKFLPTEGEYNWCLKNMPNDFPVPNDNHPGLEQHTAFTDQVIIPFLKENQYI
jgi:hypothetical protein